MGASQQSRGAGKQSPLSQVSWKTGLGYGILSFFLTLVFSSVLLLLEIGNTDEGFGMYDHPGWIDHVVADFGGRFFAAHQGAYDVPSGAGSESFGKLLEQYGNRTELAKMDSMFTDVPPIFFQTYDTIPDVVYLLLVIGVLSLFAYRMVSNRAASLDEIGGAAQGATLALGYAPLMGISVLVFGALLDSGSSVVFSDQLTDIVLIGGILYPVLFGGIVGFITGLRSNSQAQM